jgi:glutathione synthase/RimK-type ligase-like ATP-grasp enzyme
MKVLLIGGLSTDDSETEAMERYKNYFAADQDANITFAHFDDLSFVIGPSQFVVFDHRNNYPLEVYELIIFRGKVRASSELAYCVSRFCVSRGLHFVNDYSLYRSPSKLSQAVTLFELGLPAPLTIYAKNKSILERVIAQHLSYPLIIKSGMGSHGNDNFLSKSSDQTAIILQENAHLPLIAQSFFANKCDYRLLCMGGEELVIRRTAVGDTHLNNTSQGGAAELVAADFLPRSAVEQAHQFANTLKMSIAGVDLLYDDQTGQYVFLEINSQPQLTDGAFPDEKRQLLIRFMTKLAHT